MKKLLFPLPTRINDIEYASGSFFSIYKSLSNHFQLIPVGPLKLKKSLLHGFLNKLNDRNLFPWRFASMHSWKTINGYGKQLQSHIDSLEFDAIFATSTLYAAKVKTDKPVFAFTDLSYINALDYYSFASKLFTPSKKEALDVDRFCFEKHTKVFLASEWAKNKTIEAYSLSPEKIVAVGRGANLISNYNNDEFKKKLDSRIDALSKNCLFIGRNWKSKGGDVAFEIVDRFFQSGLNVKLQIVGCVPPGKISQSPFVEVYKYLNRNDENDLRVFKNLFANAWIFIMPTKSDAMGIAFNEASSFGLPSVSYNTGGVGAAVENNVTGFLFDQGDSIDTMVSKIRSLMSDNITYKSMSYKAFEKYTNENNWDTIALRLKNEIETFLK